MKHVVAAVAVGYVAGLYTAYRRVWSFIHMARERPPA